MQFLKRLEIGALAGFVSGTIILGIGGRLLMRFIAHLGGLEVGFSWGGSLEVVLLGLLIGFVSGTIFPIVGQYVFKNRSWTGTFYGALVFCSILVMPIEGKGASAGFPQLIVVIYILFGTLFAVYGWALDTLFGRWCHRSEENKRPH